MKALTKFNPFRVPGWDPFREIGDWTNRLERFFEPGLPITDAQKESMTVTNWAPAVDITEDAKEYLVKTELPDIKKEDVKITVENGELVITGERKFEKEEKDKKYHRIERSYGTFMRSFSLPDGVAGDQVTAEFKDGLLTVHLPKTAKALPKAVEVKVG